MSFSFGTMTNYYFSFEFHNVLNQVENTANFGICNHCNCCYFLIRTKGFFVFASNGFIFLILTIFNKSFSIVTV